ncbi:hypothetical protein Hanom_Chr09g00775161 [Helianthus anomalus]
MREWMEVPADDERSQDEESVSSEGSEKTPEFDQISSDSSDDDEEMNQINIGKIHLSDDSFKFYFADKLKKLKERREAKETKEVKIAKKVVEVEKIVDVEKIVEIEKIVIVPIPCLTCLEPCKQCEKKDESTQKSRTMS